ncbi:MAG: cellulase family glycosylhydrolase, partial [Frankiaceae bacterium]
ARQANIPAFNDRIQRLYAEFPDLIRGPDFWTFFREHPDLVQAGDIHPTEAGYAAMRQQWAATLTASGFGSATASSGAPAPTPAGTATPTGTATSTATPGPTPSPRPAGLHVVGNSIRNGAGEAVRLVGVNHSGTEYACVGGEDGTGEKAIFEPADFGTNAEYLRVIKSWGANSIRIGLNEHCWLGVNGVHPAYSGDRYQQAIEQFVRMATSNGLAVILELHWSAPGGFLAHGQAPMPDRDHSVAMWRQVAALFKTNGSVVFDVFNEPYPYWNEGGDGAWRCWRDGSQVADPGNATHCVGTQWWDQNGNEFNDGAGWNYQVAGMQELVDAVRDEGATNLVLMSGVQYANNLRQWLTYKPVDPVNNLTASWHSYDHNACAPSSCWDAEITPVAAAVPLVVSEFGQGGCAADYVNTLLSWLDARHASYLAWTWNTWGCGNMALLEDYASGTPTPFGRHIRDHFLAVRPEAGRPGLPAA